MAPKRLLVLCGGRSAEHEVSLLSARNVVAAVPPDRMQVTVVGITRSGAWLRYPGNRFLVHEGDASRVALAPEGTPVALCCRDGRGWLASLEGGGGWPVDVAFPVLHGTYGEDGTVQGLLALAGVPFVGCDHASSANCMDKAVTKQLLRAAGIGVAPGLVVSRRDLPVEAERVASVLGWPVFVKPARLGSSVGISKVAGPEQLAEAVEKALRFDGKVLVEGFMRGREIECAVLGNDAARASVPGEVVPLREFYSYEAKYLDAEGARLDMPARLEAETVRRVQDTAVAAFQALGCSGMARVDFFLLDDGRLVVNEINTIPGFTDISMYPRLWQLSGLTYPGLVEELVRLAEARHAAQNALCTEFA
ncbi:MAG: D-alanine--D-alanine ligase [Lentisphaeria bacterium]|nr:D-alanine--D-alanine ligase [Lentisphaeria bacterium]